MSNAATGFDIGEEKQRQLMRALQDGVPFTERPFRALGEAQELSEADVLAQVKDWSAKKVLREISAVLEGAALGYDSALVAGTVAEAEIERVAEVVSSHPTVTHNYLRNHHYNLWFTIAVPPEMNLEVTLERLASEARVEGFLPLRRTHTFKIGVNFDPETLKNRTSAVSPEEAVKPVAVTQREARMFRALQTPLSFVERPFEVLADLAEVTSEELLAFANSHLGGAIRRYVGTLRHRKLGVRENGMVVWSLAEQAVVESGYRLANAPEVSHCYARNAIEGFPYTLYSMIHGPDREACFEIAARLSAETGIADYAVLFSEREFKKQRLRYFLPELDAWWNAHL